MTIRDIAVAFGFDVDKKSVQEAEGTIKGIKSMATKLLGAIGIGFSISGAMQLAQAAADAEALKSQFTQVFGDMEEQAAKSLNSIADETGVAFNRMKGSYTQIAAFAKTTGLDQAQSLELATRAMNAVADSAAFYDRSIEDVTETMRSFLKGNFENDAALGLSATEVTRNAAANELYGKSFIELSEAEKQFTLLHMVEDANKLSGALGQAQRESDTWTNQLGNLKQALQDLKAAAGSGLLKPAVSVLKLLISGTKEATKVVQGLVGEEGLLTKKLQDMHALVKRLQPAIDRMLSVFRRGLDRAGDMLNGLVDRLGGTENVLRILGTIAGAFFAIWAWGKILKGAELFIGVLSKLRSLLTVANLKILAVVAAITILALIFEDFFQFLQGNDSLIGSVFDKLGIGADNARQTILGVFGKIKDFFVSHSEEIKAVFSALWGMVVQIIKSAVAIIGAVLSLLGSLMEAAAAIATFVWEHWGNEIKGIVSTIASWLGNTFMQIVNLITLVANLLTAIFSDDFDGAFEILKQIVALAWDFITSTLQAGLDILTNLIIIFGSAIVGIWTTLWNGISSFLTGIWNTITAYLSGVWTNLVAGVTNTISTIKQTVVDGFTAAIEWIKSLPAQAVQWGADIISGIANGITGAIGKITGAVKGIADKIKSFLHFSVPDEGPLTDYESWMPDFMSGLAKGIQSSEGTVLDRIRNLAGSIRTLMNGATAQAATAWRGSVSNRTSNVTQNVNISNSYSGGSMETQRNVSKAMKKSAVDATTEMARGLAYARG